MKNDPYPYRKLALSNARGIAFAMGAVVLMLISFLDAIPRFDCLQNAEETRLIGFTILVTWFVSWQILAEVGIRIFLSLMNYQIRMIEGDNKGTA